MFKLDFNNLYSPEEISPDLSQLVFKSVTKSGKQVTIKSVINPHPDPLLENVYNFGFGLLTEDGRIDDMMRIKHAEPSKLFSTVMFHGLFYLRNNPDRILGIDGSNDLRARLYHMMIKSNQVILEEYFKVQGVDWYVRLFRNGNIELDEEGNPFFKPKPEAFDFNRESNDLYRYYTFYLNYKHGIKSNN